MSHHIKGVKHIVANLDYSTIEKAQDDRSLLNISSHLKNSGLKEPTSFL